MYILIYSDTVFKIESKLFDDIFNYKNAFICDSVRTFNGSVESENNHKCAANVTITYFKFILNETANINSNLIFFIFRHQMYTKSRIRK